MRPTAYKRQTLALFFIVSLVPALVVAAIWYLETQTNNSSTVVVDFRSFVLPIMAIGIIPAFLLSYIFAELLTRPIRAIHLALNKLTSGRYLDHDDMITGGEFGEIGNSLGQLSIVLQRTLSETRSQGDLVAAERNKLRGVLNSMTDGVFALDSAGRIILFNHAAATLTGRTIAEVAGQLAEKVIPLRENGELVMARWLATERGTDQKIGQWKGLELYRGDGSSLYVDVQAVVLPKDPNGISALITFHDVTSGRELEEMKVDFVALAAHELRTPLTEIRGYLDILRHELTRATKDQVELLDHAIISADQLTGLVNNLLGVAGIEHGEINYQPVQVNYLKFVKELSLKLESRAKLTGREFTLTLPQRLPKIMADPIGIGEVITNLVENAFIHTGLDSGKVELRIKLVENGVETSIIDNGEGIPATAIPHLFTKFYRVGEYTAPTRGTGLGLYISKRIIDAHNGRIYVASTVGQGSTFRFTLPLDQGPSTAVESSHKITTRGAHGWIKDHPVR